MTYRALIPVKRLEDVKSRLAPHLTIEQRSTLVLDMLYHVIRTLQASNTLESISVVSPDPQVLALVDSWGANALLEKEHGHNPALYAAARDLAVGATGLLTISADLPLLKPCDIQSMIEYADR